MTKVYMKAKPNGIKEFAVSGHSGYAPTGSDIVCAAVSTLATNYFNIISEYEGHSKLSIDEMEVKDAYIKLVISDPLGYMNSVFRMLEIGFEDLRDNYPMNVQKVSEWEELKK